MGIRIRNTDLKETPVTWLTVDGLQEIYQWKYDCEDTVSYLPLSHVAGTFIGKLSLTFVSLGRYYFTVCYVPGTVHICAARQCCGSGFIESGTGYGLGSSISSETGSRVLMTKILEMYN
jgi:hypothetical protein